jgi:hypothetical protein
MWIGRWPVAGWRRLPRGTSSIIIPGVYDDDVEAGDGSYKQTHVCFYTICGCGCGGGGGSQCSQFNVTSYFASTSSVLLVTGILSRAGDPLYCPRRAPRSSAGRGEMDVGKDRLSLLELAIAWRWG